MAGTPFLQAVNGPIPFRDMDNDDGLVVSGPDKGAGVVPQSALPFVVDPDTGAVHVTASGAKAERTIIAAATSPLVESAYTVAIGGSDANPITRTLATITGASTAGTPASGYSNAVDLTTNYTFLSNASGHNESLSSNDGRTGIYAHRTKLVQAGQGDLVAYNASVRVTGAPPVGATHWLASPAGVIINGTVIGEADGVYLNPREIYLTDKPASTAYNVTCVGDVINMNRNAPSGDALGQVWSAYRAQSSGAAYVDNMLSGTGKFFSGVDLSMPSLDFGMNKVAIALKALDRMYFNASAAELDDGTTFIRQNWRATTGFNDYIYYDSATSKLKIVVGGVETLAVSNAQITATTITATGAINLASGQKLFVNGSGVVGNRVTGWVLMTGTSNKTTAYDTATVTLPQLAGRVMALEAALHITAGHGLIGA